MLRTRTRQTAGPPLSWLRPYVRQCGDERRPPWRLPGRSLLDYLLVYIHEGTGLFEIAGVRYDARPGDLFWIPPDTVHAMEGYAPSMVCPYVHFDLIARPVSSTWSFSIPGGMTDLRRFRRLMHPPIPASPVSRLCGLLRGYTNKRVGQAVREICAEAARDQPHAQLRMSGMVLEIVAEVLRGCEGLRGEYGEHAPALEEAADFIRENCADELRVGEVAGICELSSSHFRKVFGLHFGQSPREFQRRARIIKAKQLMLGSTLNLTQIADMVGFATVHSFSRAFAGIEGIAPSAYRSSTGHDEWSARRQPTATDVTR